MKQLLHLIDHYTMEIIVIVAASVALLFLIRSFKRNLLIDHGQARLVLEKYDHTTDVLNNIIMTAVLLLLVPLLVYVKFFS